MKGNLRLLIVDDHNLVCNGLKIVLKQTSLSNEIESIDTVYSGEDAIRHALKNDYHVILMDVHMPGTNGIQAAEEIITKKPSTKILAVSMYEDLEFVKGMLNSGALGYLLKDSGVEKLVRGIRTVLKGKKFFSNRIALRLIEEDQFKEKIENSGPDIKLTKREKEILSLIYHEKTNLEIASELNISKRTVDAHRLNILKKLGVKNTAGLIKYAVAKGYT